MILSAADWDLLDRSTGTKPKRDMVATDGHEAHARRHDADAVHHARPHARHDFDAHSGEGRGTPHLVAEWGGTAFNWLNNRARLHHARAAGHVLVQDLQRVGDADSGDIAAKAGADVIIANHTNFDGSKTKLPAMPRARPAIRIRTWSARKACCAT